MVIKTDEKEIEVLGDDRNYFWFKAKDELLESLVNKEKKIINIGAGVHDYDYAINFRGMANHIPYMSNQFEYAILGDVLEHIPKESRLESLIEINRVMKQDGKLLITVPAGQWLYNAHDKFLGHHCRYDKKQLIDEVEEAGFKLENIRYWNSILYFPMALHKLLNKGDKPQSDFTKLPKVINYILYKILKVEEKINYIPFGITILGEFKKVK